jgi:hypothetical protein
MYLDHTNYSTIEITAVEVNTVFTNYCINYSIYLDDEINNGKDYML